MLCVHKEEILNKQELERQVFLEFAEAAKVDVEQGSVKSEDPPIPDISCKIDGKTCYFELTRVADQAIANDIGHINKVSRKTGEAPCGKTSSYSDKEILETAVSKKAKIPHKTDGCRFDLLVYCDGYFHPRIQMDLVRESIKRLEKSYENRWNKIWLYDQTSKKILWPEN